MHFEFVRMMRFAWQTALLWCEPRWQAFEFFIGFVHYSSLVDDGLNLSKTADRHAISPPIASTM